jgi:enoyl-[acyl-carrier-protein] reductase (NADH)
MGLLTGPGSSSVSRTIGARLGSHAEARTDSRIRSSHRGAARPLAFLGSRFVEPCDVTRDGDIDALFAKVREVFGHLDILVHSVAFANKEDLKEPYVGRDSGRLDVSAYFAPWRRGPLMTGAGRRHDDVLWCRGHAGV